MVVARTSATEKAVVLQDKSLNLYNIEYHDDYNSDHIQQKSHRMAISFRKSILSRATNTTPSVMVT
ncbi:10375_t:CDS:1, partial [Ambispora gerdemannii]